MMQRFVTRLHEFIAMTGRCFRRGAFVVDLAEPSAYYWAKKVVATGTPRPFDGATHEAFYKQTVWDRRRTCGETCGDGAVILPLSKQVELPLTDFEGCGAPKKVVLAYLFAIDEHPYMYLKLESNPARSVAHAMEAIERYLLHRKKDNGLPTRRENAYKNKKPVVNPELFRADQSAWDEFLEDDDIQAMRYYDQRIRTGAEMYVPPSLTKQLLKSM